MTLTITTRRIAAIVAALVILCSCYLLGASRDSANAAVKPSSGAAATPASAAGISAAGISVSGVGKATGTPDTLRLNLSVSVTGSTVTTALAAANERAAAVQKSLQGSGVLPKDLQTSGLDIQPEYTSGKDDPPVITGYRVQESLTAVLRNLKTAGAAITAAAAAGGQATRIDGISLDLEDTGALITSARANAFTEARAKAAQYAAAAGVSLGRVVSIQKRSSHRARSPFPTPRPRPTRPCRSRPARRNCRSPSRWRSPSGDAVQRAAIRDRAATAAGGPSPRTVRSVASSTRAVAWGTVVPSDGSRSSCRCSGRSVDTAAWKRTS